MDFVILTSNEEISMAIYSIIIFLYFLVDVRACECACVCLCVIVWNSCGNFLKKKKRPTWSSVQRAIVGKSTDFAARQPRRSEKAGEQILAKNYIKPMLDGMRSVVERILCV